MAVEQQKNDTFTILTSDVTAIGSNIQIDEIDVVKTHCFCGVRFFADAAGAVEATPTAGTITITIKTVNTDPRFEDPISSNVITAATPDTIGWAANTRSVKAVQSGLDVATHYQLTVTCNET